MENFPERRCRLILIGKTGAGKSATANTILGKDIFESQAGILSQTKTCGVAITVRNNLEVLVMDTPGLCDTEGQDDVIARQITQSLFAVAPGPHAIILVLKCDARFTDQEIKVFEMLKEIFGPEMTAHMIVVFTGKDQLDKQKGGMSFEQQLQKAPKLLGLLEEAGRRYVLFNNADRQDSKEQVDQLLQKVLEVVQQNGGHYFRHRMANDVDHSMRRMIKSELWDRLGGEEPECLLDNPTIDTRNPPHKEEVFLDRKEDEEADNEAIDKEDKEDKEKKESEKEDKEEPEEDDEGNKNSEEVTSAKQQAIKIKKELEQIKKFGTVTLKRYELMKKTKDDLKRHSWDCAELKEPPTASQVDAATPATGKAPLKPARVAPRSPQVKHGDEDQHLEDRSRHSVEVKQMVESLSDDLIKELSAEGPSPFIYEVPDRPGVTTQEKRVLVEDALRRKILSDQDQLNEEQKELMGETIKSVDQKIKRGMLKHAINKISECRLM